MFPQKMDNFLRVWGTVSFSKRTSAVCNCQCRGAGTRARSRYVSQLLIISTYSFLPSPLLCTTVL